MLLDKETLLDAYDHDLEFFKEVVDMYAMDYPLLMDEIKTALQGNDILTARRVTHSIKGMVANFHADIAVQAAADLNALVKSNDLNGWEKAWQHLFQKLDELKKALLTLFEEYPV